MPYIFLCFIVLELCEYIIYINKLLKKVSVISEQGLSGRAEQS